MKVFFNALDVSWINAIYNYEKSGKNYDGTDRGEPPVCLEFSFAALDTWRGIDDRNISTKIVNESFDITIASLSEDGDSLQEFNGTVCVIVVDSDNNDINYTGWKKLDEFENNVSESNWTDIKVSEAVKKVKVKIAWQENNSSNCPILDEDGNNTSADEFAVRPDRFEMIADNEMYAGEDFNLSVYAYNINGNGAKEYNETYNSSFELEFNVSSGCIIGDYRIDDFNFSNGEALNVNTMYDDVGDINITIKEINGSEFAIVDADDTNDSDRLIKSYSLIKRVDPYKAKIDTALIRPADKSWVYVANIDVAPQMSVTAEINISFLSKSDGELKDFNESCYLDDDVKVKFDFDVEENNNSDLTLKYRPDSIELNKSIDDSFDISFDVNKSLFDKGKAYKEIIFNIERNFTRPLNPIEMNLSDTNVSNVNYKVLNRSIENNRTIFYYGRLAPEYDYSDDGVYERSIIKSVQFLVYSSNGRYVDENDLRVGSLWYGVDHDDKVEGNISFAAGYVNTIKNELEDGVNVTIVDDIGKELNLSTDENSTFDAWIHLNISQWLWYGLSEDGFRRYNDSQGSSCLEHPCFYYKFNYRRDNDNLSEGVISGDFNGSDYDINVSRRVIRPRIFR